MNFHHYEDDRPATMAEADREFAHNVGREQPGVAWILSDRDVFYKNPFYQGPPVPHPNDDDWGDEPTAEEIAELEASAANSEMSGAEAFCAIDDELTRQAANAPQADATNYMDDDIPFSTDPNSPQPVRQRPKP